MNNMKDDTDVSSRVGGVNIVIDSDDGEDDEDERSHFESLSLLVWQVSDETNHLLLQSSKNHHTL